MQDSLPIRSLAVALALVTMAVLLPFGVAPAGAQQDSDTPQRVSFFPDQPPPVTPDGVTVTQDLYTVVVADALFSCDSPLETAVVADSIGEADYHCLIATNENATAVDQFAVFEPDFSPAYEFVPANDEPIFLQTEIPILAAGETFTIMRFVPTTAAWTVARTSDAAIGSIDYRPAVEELVAAGVAQPQARTASLWDDQIAFERATDFDIESSKWDVLGIQDYEFAFQANCFCIDGGQRYDVRVIGGEIDSITGPAPGIAAPGNPAVGEVAPDGDVPEYRRLSIDDMVDAVLDARTERGAWASSGQTDPLYGFPRGLWIDENPMIADEEIGYQVLDFAPLVACGDAWERFDPMNPQPEPNPKCGSGSFLGDVDCDGFHTIIDAFLVVLYSIAVIDDAGACPEGIGPRSLNVQLADMNDDNAINIIDALLIARCSVGLDKLECAAARS